MTPLTDRIYVTATQALHLSMGCAPAGPAGTGKTETTKDLASALGKACYVFNCSDQMDYQSMANIFKVRKSKARAQNKNFEKKVPLVHKQQSFLYRLVKALFKAHTRANQAVLLIFFSLNCVMQGLAASGSWGCFDEFNRLVPAVLSVCSVQFKAVVDAIKAHADTFFIQGDLTALDPTCGVFITVSLRSRDFIENIPNHRLATYFTVGMYSCSSFLGYN